MSGRKSGPGNGPLAKRPPEPAGPQESDSGGSAEDECSDTAGTAYKSERAAGLTGLRWTLKWK